MDKPENIIHLEDRLQSLGSAKKQRAFRRIMVAALAGIPWIGSIFTLSQGDANPDHHPAIDPLLSLWLDEHRAKMSNLASELYKLAERLASLPDDAHERLESESFPALVQKAFRGWDQSDFDFQRECFIRLVGNAAALEPLPDDLAGLYLDWLGRFRKLHLAALREIANNPGTTRHDIWTNIRGETPWNDSCDADLFRLLMAELADAPAIKLISTADVAIQPPSESHAAFSKSQRYELTRLGQNFARYAFPGAPKPADASAA